MNYFAFYCPLLEIAVLFAVGHDQIDGFRVVPDQKMLGEITPDHFFPVEVATHS